MEFADYIEILKALGESTRLHIFEMLRNGTLAGVKFLNNSILRNLLFRTI